MFEIEQKFHVDDLAAVRRQLAALNAAEQPTEVHADTYYNHPCRDFGETKEAFRVRRVNDRPMITYKGPKQPGAVKARQELEWPLDPGDRDGSKTEQLLTLLSFRRVATVKKKRHPFGLPQPWTGLTVVLDEVENLGSFVEIEILAEGEGGIEPAKSRVLALAKHLDLRVPEPRSYLTMILERKND